MEPMAWDVVTSLPWIALRLSGGVFKDRQQVSQLDPEKFPSSRINFAKLFMY